MALAAFNVIWSITDSGWVSSDVDGSAGRLYVVAMESFPSDAATEMELLISILACFESGREETQRSQTSISEEEKHLRQCFRLANKVNVRYSHARYVATAKSTCYKCIDP